MVFGRGFLTFLITIGLLATACSEDVTKDTAIPSPTVTAGETTQVETTRLPPSPALPSPSPQPEATETATPAVTRTPDLTQMDVREWTAKSPHASWLAEGVAAFPTRGGRQYYTRLLIRSADGDTEWTILDRWQDWGLGYTIPRPLHWAGSRPFFYYTNEPVPDGCGIFINGSDLHEVYLPDGSTRQVLSPVARWLSLSPGDLQVAYVPFDSGALVIHRLTSRRGPEQRIPLEMTGVGPAGHIVWSPDGTEIMLTVAQEPCAEGRLAASTSIVRVDLEKETVESILSEQRRLLLTEAWYSDGTVLLQTPDENHAWLMDPDTGELTAVDVDAGEQAQPAAAVYHPDPAHLWNRLFRHFYVRTAGDESYGGDVLDPLLWPETEYLLDGPSHETALALLDEFISREGQTLIDDPLKRAMLQRDLWAVFDWLTQRSDDHRAQRRALERRLADAIRWLALPREEILALPDNYEAAVNAGAFAAGFQESTPYVPFLPPDLFADDGNWLNVGRRRGPMAVSHLQNYPFLGRSAFLVYYRTPPDGPTTQAYLQQLQDAEPIVQQGMQVALVRRTLLIDVRGRLALSPLVEMVQLRHALTDWQVYEFNLSRNRLFTGLAGGLRPMLLQDETFSLFMSHAVDRFEDNSIAPEFFLSAPLQRCETCHGVLANRESIISLSRSRFFLPDEGRPLLQATTPQREAEMTMAWKRAHESWRRLQAHWR